MDDLTKYLQSIPSSFNEVIARGSASRSIESLRKQIEQIEKNPPRRTGLASGRYPELRAIRKSQVALQGGEKWAGLNEPSGASYSHNTRLMYGNKDFVSGARGIEAARHEKWHDVQNVGRQLNRHISTPLERATWKGFPASWDANPTKGMSLMEIAQAQNRATQAASGLRGGFGQFALEGQAYVVGKKSIPAGIGQFIRSAEGYVDNPRYAAGRPFFKTLATVNKANEAGRNLLPAAKQLGTVLGSEAASVGGMALRGAGRLAGPVGVAMTAYDLAQAFPAPAPISEEEMGRAMREYRTGPQPQFAR
jgi:hypothetical protein